MPVLLTVQVDSVGLNDSVIPANVRAADPDRTKIIGNNEFSYLFRPINAPPGSASWARRKLRASHAKMELDSTVWAQVEQLILDAIPKS